MDTHNAGEGYISGLVDKSGAVEAAGKLAFYFKQMNKALRARNEVSSPVYASMYHRQYIEAAERVHQLQQELTSPAREPSQ